jgi:mannose-6-phosphate isomerase-like protein (cupin superfamily)
MSAGSTRSRWISDASLVEFCSGASGDRHKDTDETFIVIDGELRIDFRDGAVHVSTGEMFVVPKGVEHKPSAEKEVELLLIEPRGVLNTGHEGGERTADNDVWI